MKGLSLCALLWLVTPAALAADARPAKPKFDINVPAYSLNTKVFDFPTGLRIMFQSDRSHEVVGVYMVVNHGTKDDPEGKEETAHFTEHTWFRSRHGQLPPIMDVVQDIGADFNATTWNDLTDYRTVASSEYLPLLLRLESLRLTEPYAGVTEEDIDVEREVIRSEWRRRNEQDWALLFDYLYEAVYPADHAYHDHSTHDSIDNIKLADLQKFMDDYYKPENTTIMIVGDFDPDEAASLIFDNFDPKLLHPKLTSEMYFFAPRPGIENPDQNNPAHWLTGAWDPDAWDQKDAQGSPTKAPFRFSTREAPRVTEERPPVPDVGTTEVLTRKGPFPNKLVVVGWSLPGGYRDDHWSIGAVANFANNYIGNGLFDYLDNKQIGDWGCFSQVEVVNSTVACMAEIKDKKLDPLIVRDKMLDQLSQMWNPENTQGDTINAAVSNTYFTRSKMQAMATQLMNLDLFAVSFGSRTEEIARHAHYNNSAQAHSDSFGDIMKMQMPEISQIAYQFLKRDRAATVIIEPLSADEIDIGSEHSSYRGANATDQVLRSSDDLSQVTKDQIESAYVPPSLEGLVDYTLPNGLRVVILKHGEAPTLQASLMFKRNFVDEPHGFANFVAAFTESAGNDALPIAAVPSWYSDPGIPGIPPTSDLYTRPRALLFCSNPELTGRLSCPDQFNTWGNAMRVFVQAPAGNLDGALWLLREEIETAHPYLDGKSDYLRWERESLSGDVKDEQAADWLSADWHIDRLTREYLYPDDHPQGHVTTWADVTAMEAWGNADVDKWLATHLQPAASTLVIVGNVDPAAAKQAAEQYFGGWKADAGAGEPVGTPEPARLPTDPSVVYVFDSPNMTQTDVTTSCRLNYSDPSQDTAVSILGSLLRSKTFSQMRVAEGLAYSPGASAGISSDGSARLTFYSDGVINSGVARIFTFYNEAMKEVESGKLDEKEVVLHQLRISRESGVAAQSMAQMTDQLASVIRKGKGWDFLSNQGAIIADVDKQDLVDLVKGCSEHTVTTIVGPKDVVTPQLDELGVPYKVVSATALGEELLFTYAPKEAARREKDKQKKDKKAAKEAEKKEKEEGEEGDEKKDAPAPVVARSEDEP